MVQRLNMRDAIVTYSENLWIFFTLLFGIIIVPGMDMALVLANSLSNGRSSGLAATAGVMTGGLLHSLYAALGVGALLRFFPTLFDILLIAGAAYVAWIGYALMRSSIVMTETGTAKASSLTRIFSQGIVSCLLNPKAYLFMLAIYPQFVKPEYGAVWTQALVMAAMIAIVQAGIYGSLALFAGRSRYWLQNNPGMTIAIGRGAGLLLIAMAALTLFRAFPWE